MYLFKRSHMTLPVSTIRATWESCLVKCVDLIRKSAFEESYADKLTVSLLIGTSNHLQLAHGQSFVAKMHVQLGLIA